jgi:malonyl-CoA O-methyltransferase
MSLSIKRFTALQSESDIECVLIHGWGVSSIIWSQWQSFIQQYCNVTVIDLPGYGSSELTEYSDLDSLIECCIQLLPKNAVYIGYSLGGMLALKMAARNPERVQAVVTLASNPRFVADNQWPQAMPSKTFDAFRSGVKNNAQKTLSRFMALQINGAKQEKALLKDLRRLSDEKIPCAETLCQSLDLLARMDCRALLAELNVPSLHVFGENDQLVPVSVAENYPQQSSLEIEVIKGAPHALFFSHPQQSWDLIYRFLVNEKILAKKNLRALDKKQVARSFSRAASTYDSVAELQRRVGQQLQAYLPDGSASVVLDLGCGTGFFSEPLSQHCSASTLIGLDLAEGMVKFASDHHRGNTAAWLCGDAESLPLADNTVDIVFSSLAIQWCEDNDTLFSEIARVLKPGGSFVVSTLGPNTLHELRKAWRSADNCVHVNQFVDKAVLLNSAQKAGLVGAGDSVNSRCSATLEEETITLEYDTLKNLTRELKSLGAHNVNSGRPSGLMGKQRLRAFMQGYENQRNEQGRLPASYQVWYGVWSKEHHVGAKSQTRVSSNGS